MSCASLRLTTLLASILRSASTYALNSRESGPFEGAMSATMRCRRSGGHSGLSATDIATLPPLRPSLRVSTHPQTKRRGEGGLHGVPEEGDVRKCVRAEEVEDVHGHSGVGHRARVRRRAVVPQVLRLDELRHGRARTEERRTSV